MRTFTDVDNNNSNNDDNNEIYNDDINHTCANTWAPQGRSMYNIYITVVEIVDLLSTLFDDVNITYVGIFFLYPSWVESSKSRISLAYVDWRQAEEC